MKACPNPARSVPPIVTFTGVLPYRTAPQPCKTDPTAHSAPSGPSIEAYPLGRNLDQYPYSSALRKFKRRYRECPGNVVYLPTSGCLGPGTPDQR
jgi:hypothetical protein